MKKNIAIAVLSVVCLALLIGEVCRLVALGPAPAGPPEKDALESRQRVLADLEVRMQRLQTRLDERDAELADLRSVIGGHDKPDDLAEAMPSAVTRPVARVADDTAEDAAEPLAGLGKQIAGLLSNTNFLQSMIAQGLRGGRVAQDMERDYKDFFGKLGLSDEQIAKAMEWVGRHNRLASIPGLDDLPADGDDAFEEQMRELLGADGYEEYQRFNETRKARRMVNRFQGFLADEELSIGDDQRERLINMFHQAGAADDGNDLGGGLTFSLNADEGSAAGENIENSLDSLVVKYDQLADDADDVLDAKQSAQFRQFLDRQLERKEMEGDIARSLMPALKMEGIEGLPAQGSVQVIAAPPVVVGE